MSKHNRQIRQGAVSTTAPLPFATPEKKVLAPIARGGAFASIHAAIEAEKTEMLRAAGWFADRHGDVVRSRFEWRALGVGVAHMVRAGLLVPVAGGEA